MSAAELEERMAGFLKGEYAAVLLEGDERPLGYALYRRDADWIYLRQFFVIPEQRRMGIGRAAFAWLQRNAWQDTARPDRRLDQQRGGNCVLAFADYCLTMELEPDSNPLPKTELTPC